MGTPRPQLDGVPGALGGATRAERVVDVGALLAARASPGGRRRARRRCECAAFVVKGSPAAAPSARPRDSDPRREPPPEGAPRPPSSRRLPQAEAEALRRGCGRVHRDRRTRRAAEGGAREPRDGTVPWRATPASASRRWMAARGGGGSASDGGPGALLGPAARAAADDGAEDVDGRRERRAPSTRAPVRGARAQTSRLELPLVSSTVGVVDVVEQISTRARGGGGSRRSGGRLRGPTRVRHASRARAPAGSSARSRARRRPRPSASEAAVASSRAPMSRDAVSEATLRRSARRPMYEGEESSRAAAMTINAHASTEPRVRARAPRARRRRALRGPSRGHRGRRAGDAPASFGDVPEGADAAQATSPTRGVVWLGSGGRGATVGPTRRSKASRGLKAGTER